ncbi:Kazal-type serine protease inhibitor family protein [Nannocystis pusilla]|uniref:Kazal-type serine protease inhibitor family protein n=1 Tax=Nannocystis pusilla TaxID=889268 RepID=A0ABS7TKN1_9BACT|nr:Kazal-type serine protease inhibitor family protein [Nannocystis pusilla]MBZ5708676.1 Kazal-type serine protease inhibitor family protein [Nannocystis pusilla]
MHHSSFVLLACVSVLSLSPACDSPAPKNPEEAGEQSGPGAAEQETFYIVTRRDVRKCAAPMCGGFYVQRVNQDTTTCADGKAEKECYVGTVDLAALKLDPAGEDAFREAFGQRHALVRGGISLGVDPKFPEIGALVASEGWSGRAGVEPKGEFLRVRGIHAKCAGLPCPSASAFRLNTDWQGLFAGIDLAAGGAPQEVQDAANQTMYETPEGILAAATTSEVTGPNGTMKALVASEFYTRATGAAAGGPECGGIRGLACGEGQFCDPSQCGGADIGGTCRARPEACTFEYSPVCGCDDKTYGNDCARQSAGVGLAYKGECKPAGS